MDMIKVVRLALDVLTDKVISVVSLILGFILSAWVMYEPDFYRLMSLIVYTIFSLFITVKFMAKPEENKL
jgi:hypothetical protein